MKEKNKVHHHRSIQFFLLGYGCWERSDALVTCLHYNRPYSPSQRFLRPSTRPRFQAQKAISTDMAADGSLWRDDAPMLVLFSDSKARTVGDIVTIKIAESSDATNQATTATDRDSSLSASIDGFFGLEEDIPASASFNPFSAVAGGVESGFEGSGTTTRRGDLNAYITAMVTQVLPNGNLVLTGSREVLINNENQVIELTGIVRPRDINANNQVLSTYVADARISYSGTGIINDRQRPGWLTNIVMAVWPF
jgi:flagellar L-ring protein precursor FlgH